MSFRFPFTLRLSGLFPLGGNLLQDQGSKSVDRIGSDRDPDRGSPIRVERDPGNFGFTRARVDLDPENFLITRARADLDPEFFLCPISQIIFMP